MGGEFSYVFLSRTFDENAIHRLARWQIGNELGTPARLATSPFHPIDKLDHRRNASHFRRSTLDCTGKRFSNGKGKRKHENKIVCRRACCERGHDCSSEPRSCSRSERGISRRDSYTQWPGGSCSDAARRCFIVPLDADAVIRQSTVLFRPTLSLV